jgi:hypothetical protein
MPMNDPYDEPCNVSAKNGVVFVRGPGLADFALSPLAALEMAERMFRAGLVTHEQIIDPPNNK